MLLALDTSTSAITAAVHDGAAVVAEDAVLDARRHTESVAPTIGAVLAAAGITPDRLERIAVGVGPGPFTGLRVGIVTAVTMGYALGIPVVGVPSLDALAAGHAELGGEGEFLVATDARRKEVYWGRYRAGGGVAVRLSGPEVAKPADVPESLRLLPVVGRGALLYPELLPVEAGPLDVSAGALARLAVSELAAGTDLPVTPLYLRRPDAVELPR